MVTLAATWTTSILPCLIDHASICQQDFQLLDAPFDKSLLVFGGFVFGVFDQLAAFHGLMQALGNFLAFLRAQDIPALPAVSGNPVGSGKMEAFLSLSVSLKLNRSTGAIILLSIP